MNEVKYLNSINTFSLTNKNILSIIENIPIFQHEEKKKKIITKEKIKNKKNNDFFIPEQKDSLFWCWFIFKFGLGEYTVNKSHIFTTEKTHKINFIEKIRKIEFKKKWKFKKNEVETNLANDNMLYIKTLEAMLISDQNNLIFMNNKIYYENIEFPENKTCIIKYFSNSEKYGLLLEEDKLFDYKNNLFIVDDINKPVKNISTYKAQELKDICKKLNINIMKTPTKCKTKKVLYELICQKII